MLQWLHGKQQQHRYFSTTAIRLNSDNSNNSDDVMKGLFRSRRSKSIIKEDTITDSVENSSDPTRKGTTIDLRKARMKKGMIRRSLSPAMRIQNMIDEKISHFHVLSDQEGYKYKPFVYCTPFFDSNKRDLL